LITEEQRKEILRRLEEGETDSARIAAEVGASKMHLAALKAWRTMRHDAPADEAAEVVDAIDTTFGLERDLQEALLKNIGQLEEGLSVAPNGREYSVPAGRIDILATDAQRSRVVIELKAGTADREAIGQILSYMGDLQIADAEIPVRGMLVAADFTPRANAAARAVSNIELRSYVSFRQRCLTPRS
jgi:RecB family endonuclease NucS